jgi:hypothetical protein
MLFETLCNVTAVCFSVHEIIDDNVRENVATVIFQCTS